MMNKRIKMFEGNSIWYQIWIDGRYDENRTLLEGGDRLWCMRLEYYVFLWDKEW